MNHHENLEEKSVLLPFQVEPENYSDHIDYEDQQPQIKIKTKISFLSSVINQIESLVISKQQVKKTIKKNKKTPNPMKDVKQKQKGKNTKKQTRVSLNEFSEDASQYEEQFQNYYIEVDNN
ncbi:unnamed protein product [Paramecium sonneborni]|uniref:Uncharacterized protein n=1 Tax=Paramecium sonneborni TaxID=65129 RepID=A0A8S1LS15_9CILI|nr:unnamed protein product [Paramecium sonneborni]